MLTSYIFTKQERLKSKKEIEILFSNRQSVGAYPLRVFWAEAEQIEPSPYRAKMAFNVSKKTFKQAVKRNRYKRLMREIHRLHKHKFYKKLEEETKTLHLMLIYVGKGTCDFATIEKKYLQLMDKLLKQITS
jgi:ribonuclease P protein component